MRYLPLYPQQRTAEARWAWFYRGGFSIGIHLLRGLAVKNVNAGRVYLIPQSSNLLGSPSIMIIYLKRQTEGDVQILEKNLVTPAYACSAVISSVPRRFAAWTRNWVVAISIWKSEFIVPELFSLQSPSCFLTQLQMRQKYWTLHQHPKMHCSLLAQSQRFLALCTISRPTRRGRCWSSS